KVFTLLGALLGMLLAALDQTVVATAGPAIQAHLHVEPSLYAWITTAYLVTSTVMVPIYGKLSDLLGRKAILVAGIIIFLLGSLLCGIAGSALQLILYRAIQGMGSAALFTSAFAVVADIFPPAVRGKYQGMFGAVFALSSVVGPLAGGFITDRFGWHWVFFINLPVGAIALAFIFLRMPALRRRISGSIAECLDIPGALALMLAVVPLLLALSLGERAASPGSTGTSWGSWQILSLFAVATLGVAFFLRAERSAKNPILDLRLFRNRTFAVGNLAAFVIGSGFLGSIVFLPLFMVNVVGLSATSSGLTLTPLTLGLVAGNVVSGQIVARIGKYKALIMTSLVLLVIGYAVMGFSLSPQSSQAEVTLKMFLVGIGLGPSIPLFTLVVQNAVPVRQVGVATSSVTFFRQLGSTVGLAILGTIFGASLTGAMRTRMAEATVSAPPEVRAQIGAIRAPGSAPARAPAEGGEGTWTFRASELKAQIHARFEARRAQAPGPGDRAQLARDEAHALDAVDRVHDAFKWGFTDAVATVYRCAILIAVLALVIVIFLPELPLRRTLGPPPMAE
ncbi:MAG TPA: MDR family MFS transporter, partial [Haliangium sp.]|nr:MDR family MFS transporter [Haliangium sp.]